MKTLIIAEAGVNHNGSLDKAKKLVDIAKYAGADIVKFQTFDPDKLVTKLASKAKYQKKNTKDKETQYQMLQKFVLKPEEHHELVNYSRKKRIEFLSTPFDDKSLKMLLKLGIRRIKIPSGEINNRQLLNLAGKQKVPIILSTGMSYLNEVSEALKVITKSGTPKSKITVLHCISEYPTRFQDVNLLAMNFIKKKLDVSIGYSDHTLGSEVSIAAVTSGAEIIEKHFTISRKLIGPDHKSSLEPSELKNFVNSIRNVEKSFGRKSKFPTKNEKKNRLIVRKSIVALKFIKKGDIFSLRNVGAKRPGTGISPMRIFKVIGKRAKRNFNKDQLIQE